MKLFYARKLDEALSPTTVHHMHGVLHRALEDAVRMGLVQRNVADLVSAPRRQTREMQTLTEDQATGLLAVVDDDRFGALYWLALTTGMRELACVKGNCSAFAGKMWTWSVPPSLSE